MSTTDRQGYFYLLVTTAVPCVLRAKQRWLTRPANHERRPFGRVAIGALMATATAAVYNKVVAPHAILRLNGYWPDLSYQDVPFERFNAALASDAWRMFREHQLLLRQRPVRDRLCSWPCPADLRAGTADPSGAGASIWSGPERRVHRDGGRGRSAADARRGDGHAASAGVSHSGPLVLVLHAEHPRRAAVVRESVSGAVPRCRRRAGAQDRMARAARDGGGQRCALSVAAPTHGRFEPPVPQAVDRDRSIHGIRMALTDERLEHYPRRLTIESPGVDGARV